MVLEFCDRIDSISEDGVVRFQRKPGAYILPPHPADLSATLQAAKRGGQLVRVSYDDRTLEIRDVLLE